MAVIHGFNAQLFFMTDPLFGTVNLTGRSNDVTMSLDAPAADVTGFGSVAKSFVIGQYGWKLDAKGFCDVAVGTQNPGGAFSSAIMAGGTGAIGSILFMPEGTVTGRPIWRGAGYITTYSATSNLGGGVSWSASFQGSGTVTRTTCA